MTRSRTQVPSAVQVLAKRFLETEASVIVTIDEDELKFLLASAEKCTDGATVEQLERLYSHISQAIYSHRNNPDKTELTQVGTVQAFTRSLPPPPPLLYWFYDIVFCGC